MQDRNVHYTWPWASILTIIFFVLKVTHVIAWSWWWVFSPLLFVAGFLVVVFLIAGIILTIGINNK
jgi:hypothetical protein